MAHPLLGAAVELPGTGGLVLTGRLSLAAQPWLADHVVAGQVLVPGAALAELAARAGAEAGCGLVRDLLIDVPLALPARGAVQLRVIVEPPGENGYRRLALYSRAEATGADGPWARHASGELAAEAGPVSDADLAALVPWPPPGGVAVDLAGFYPALAGQGYGFGPVFRGVRAVWRREAEVFAEVALPEGTPAAGFGVHPALLEAAWHAAAAAGLPEAGAREPGPLAPLAWGGLAVPATGAPAVRVRVTPRAEGQGLTLIVADEAGNLVASAESVGLRPLPDAEPGGAPDGADRAAIVRDALFRLEWRPAPVPVETGAGPVRLPRPG